MVVLDCPFCRPGPDDVVIAETPHAIALCDARPLCVGHILICPKGHFASLIDTPATVLNHVAALQYEIRHRLVHTFGEAGMYEHGRSALSRFHTAPGDFCHAHVHAIPIADDILRFVKVSQSWRCVAPEAALLREQDYFYQEGDVEADRMWALGISPSPHHCVRGLIENSFNKRHKKTTPLSATPAEHRFVIEQTVAAVSGAGLRALNSVALCGNEDAPVLEVATLLRARLGWPIVEVLPFSSIAPGKKHSRAIFVCPCSDDLPIGDLRVMLGDSATLHLVRRPTLLRVLSSGVETEDLAEVITETIMLRDRRATLARAASHLCA